MKEYIFDWYEFTTKTPEGEIHRLRFQHRMEVIDLLWWKEELADLLWPELLFTAYHGLKAFIDCTFNNALESGHLYKTSSTIKAIMGKFSPGEFIRIFPITFCFESNQIKDCYPILAKIEQMDHVKSLGKEIDLFLLDYPNEDIQLFNELDARVTADYKRAKNELEMLSPYEEDDEEDDEEHHKN